MATIAEMLSKQQIERLTATADKPVPTDTKPTRVRIVQASALPPQKPEYRGRGWRRAEGKLK